LRDQQPRIEEIEERGIAEERIKEIAVLLQAQMISEFEGEKKETKEPMAQASITGATRSYSIGEKVKVTEEYLDGLQRGRQQKYKEQQKMEAVLHERRIQLAMVRMGTERYLQQTALMHGRSQQNQVRAQEQLRSQWKHASRQKEKDLAAIRQHQDDIMNKWQNDNF